MYFVLAGFSDFPCIAVIAAPSPDKAVNKAFEAIQCACADNPIGHFCFRDVSLGFSFFWQCIIEAEVGIQYPCFESLKWSKYRHEFRVEEALFIDGDSGGPRYFCLLAEVDGRERRLVNIISAQDPPKALEKAFNLLADTPFKYYHFRGIRWVEEKTEKTPQLKINAQIGFWGGKDSIQWASISGRPYEANLSVEEVELIE